MANERSWTRSSRQYWTSGRTQTEIDDALAGSGFLDQTAGDARHFARAQRTDLES